jgi:hypothetical protein
VLKEVIDVRGRCWEDHVRQHDNYAGQIVRWQTIATGQILTYGFLAKEGDLAQHVMEEVLHPNLYHTPQLISFLEIDIDTNEPKWELHGISNRGPVEEKITGYASTCNVEVIKRGMEIRSPVPLDSITR